MYSAPCQVPATTEAAAAPPASPEDSDVELTFDEPMEPGTQLGWQEDGMKMAWLAFRAI